MRVGRLWMGLVGVRVGGRRGEVWRVARREKGGGGPRDKPSKSDKSPVVAKRDLMSRSETTPRDHVI